MTSRSPRRRQGPSVKGIHHVAIAVPSLDAALPVYRDLFGFQLHGIEDVPDQQVRVAVLLQGPHRIELVEPATDASPISKFLAKRGAGLHHVCLDVKNLAGLLDNLKAAGVPLLDEVPRDGAEGRKIAFVHPKGSSGVLIELSEAPAPPKPAPAPAEPSGGVPPAALPS